MVTFITSLILYGCAAAVLGLVGKLIYDIQKNKKQEKEADYKKQFQKLAGIGQPKNELDPEIWKYIADKVSNEGFPEPDKSIPIKTATITTIGGSYYDSDPLASVPLSRVSKAAKQKMAEIAKKDISDRLEEATANIVIDTTHSDNGQTDLRKTLTDSLITLAKKPATKKKNPKQTASKGTDENTPFAKTRKKL